MSTESFTIEVDSKLKREAEIVLEQLGYSLEEVVDLLLRFVVAHKRLPKELEMRLNDFNNKQ